MGIKYQILPELRAVIEVWDGVITADQWRTHVETYLADPLRQRCDRSLVDLRTADASGITDTDETSVVGLYVPHARELSSMRNAAIASTDFEPSVEFAHRIEQLGLRVIIFNEATGACTYLGLDSSEIQPVLHDLRSHLRNETLA